MKAKLIKNHFGFEYFLADENGSAIATSDNGKLSKQNCDEIFGVVDVESLALSKASFFGGTYRNPEGFSDEQVGYLHGFIEAMELNKDKRFTLGDMKRVFNCGRDLESIDRFEDWRTFTHFINSLEPTEIEVEIEMIQGMRVNGIQNPFPVKDSDGCLILKKIEQ